MPDAVLVVGLGNPGQEYDRTRHNIGFLVADALAHRWSVGFSHPRGERALVAEARHGSTRVVLAKPLTYMNLSGEAVQSLVRYHRIDARDVIAIHDDVDLPFGEIRVKRGGGEGGHNGLRSLTKHLGTKEYLRVRVGVGRPSGRQPTADYVLSAFSADEVGELGAIIEQTADEVARIASEGFEELEAERKQPPPKSRRLKLHQSVPADVASVFERWTTPSGIASFFAPACSIGSAPREPYEIYFSPSAPEGARGSEGCTIITLSPPTRLAFTWNAPPTVPALREAEERTRVSVLLKRKGADTTLVTLTHTGWGTGPDWDACYGYFEEAWPVVLERLRAVCAGGVMDWETRTVRAAPVE
jgi:peptidyl-tRNA hydrolase, PTH1 family